MPLKENQKNNFYPNFKIDKLPTIKIKSIRFQNFKVFEDYTFNFSEKGICKDFICFVGLNGLGKSTILNTIQLLFNKFEGYDQQRILNNLAKHVRHTNTNTNAIYSKDDFLITAKIQSSFGNYTVKINKNGFLKDHPKKIKEMVYRLCYSTRIDKELNTFQLERKKWKTFKKIFEAITGFTIEENKTLFDQSGDPKQADLLKKHVLGFLIKKPSGIISHTECSDGEKKIIKSFSTILNMEYVPQVILIDNVEMHVDRTRHLAFIHELQRCYPDSQIFSTTHSYYISRNFGQKSQIYDLRLLNTNDLIKKEPWRLCIIDEIEDCLLKIGAMNKIQNKSSLISYGKKLLVVCNGKINDLQTFKIELKEFFKLVSDNFVCDLLV